MLQFLESLPTGPLYVIITVLAAVENIFPPVPADTAVALGAFLAGRGRMDPWVVFGLTWSANVGAASAVYALARRYGRAVFSGRLGVRLLSEHTLDRIGQEWERHGWIGIFLSRLLPVWRGLVCPFAGMGNLPAGRTLAAVALASGAYYGALTFFVYQVGGNIESVMAAVGRVNAVLAGVAVLVAVGVAWSLWRARRRTS